MDLKKGILAAEWLKKQLSPYCDRIEIAGSIRRKKEFPKDIELICIPREISGGLFGSSSQRDPDFCQAVSSVGQVVKWDGKKQAHVPATWKQDSAKYVKVRGNNSGVILDLFILNKTNWGLLKLVRTGPALYSQGIYARFNRRGYVMQGGYPCNTETGEVLEFKEEEDVYEFLKIPWKDPMDRNEINF